MSVVEAEVAPTGRGRARRPAKPRRTGAALHGLKRTKEGREFELYGIAPELEPAGYQVTLARLSQGPYDVAAWRPGRLLLIAARLTGVTTEGEVATNPAFRVRELAVLWEFAQKSQPGFEIVPLVATALHAAAPGKGCRCSGQVPDRARFLILTGPPAGQSRRANWEPWVPVAA